MSKENTKKSLNTFDLIVNKIGKIKDERNGAYIYYTLEEIIFLIFCGTLVGCKSYQEIVDFGEERIDWFRKYLNFKKGIPSHDTLNKVMGMLDTKELEKVFSEITSYQIKLKEGSVVSIDGKWIGKSATSKEKQTKYIDGGKLAIQMVNVFCKELNACLASVKVGLGKGERSMLGDVFKMLELSKCTITMDAGFCHKEVVNQVVEAKADYIIGLKANQPSLLELTKQLFEDDKEVQYNEKSRGHGRIEERSCKVLDLKEMKNGLDESQQKILEDWNQLNLLIEVERKRETIRTEKITIEKKYYISSKKITAKEASEMIRDHWGIENNLHWVLDVVLGEDDNTNRTKNSAANLSLIRKLAYNKLKSKPEKAVSINRKMRKGLMNLDYFNNILGL